MTEFILSLIYWLAGLVVFAEALNKLERSELFTIDEVLRQRLAAMRGARRPIDRFFNRLKCFGFRLISMRDRAINLLRTGGWRRRLVDLLKVAGWVLLAAGAGGVLVSPLLEVPVAGANVCTTLGFATLILRTRVREAIFKDEDRTET